MVRKLAETPAPTRKKTHKIFIGAAAGFEFPDRPETISRVTGGLRMHGRPMS